MFFQKTAELLVTVHFFRAMLCISAAYVVIRSLYVCLSVCVSVTFVSCVKKNKKSSNCFHHRVATPFKFFHTKRGGAIPTETLNPFNGGVECRWGRQKTRFWTNIWLRCIQVYSVINRTSRDGRRRASSTPRRPSSPWS